MHVAVASSIGRPLLYTCASHFMHCQSVTIAATRSSAQFIPNAPDPNSRSYVGEVWSYKKVAVSQALLQFPPQKSPPHTPPPDPEWAFASPPMSPPGLNRLAAHNMSTFATEMLTQNLRSRSPSPNRSPSPAPTSPDDTKKFEDAELKPSWP